MDTLTNKVVRSSAAVVLMAGAFTLAPMLGSGTGQAEATSHDNVPENVVLATCSDQYRFAIDMYRFSPSSSSHEQKRTKYATYWLLEGEKSLPSSDISCKRGLEAQINGLVGAAANLRNGGAFLKMLNAETGQLVFTMRNKDPIRGATSFSDPRNRVDYIPIITERKGTDPIGGSFTYPVLTVAALTEDGSFQIIAEDPVVPPIYRPEGSVKAENGIDHRWTRGSFVIGVGITVPIRNKGVLEERVLTVEFYGSDMPPVSMPMSAGLLSSSSDAWSAFRQHRTNWTIEQSHPLTAHGKSRVLDDVLKPVLQQIKSHRYTMKGYERIQFTLK